MKRIGRVALPLVFAGAAITVVLAQRAFRQYPSVEYGEAIPLPPDWNLPAEWTFARLMFPPGPLDGYRGRFDGPWQEGLSLWTQDYPRADRALANAVRRLTRVQARSVEQPVSLDIVIMLLRAGLFRYLFTKFLIGELGASHANRL